jgi:Na+-transporting NADH:ubiquinone oxidoreductase subunit NqrB
MIKIILHIIVALFVSFYEFEQGHIATELIVLEVLLGFSYSMLINVVRNQKVKTALFVSGILFLLILESFLS